MERRRFSQTMASEWQTAFVSHKMSWCALLTSVKNYIKSLGKSARLFLQDWDQDQMFKTKTKTSWSKTKTFIFFVLEAPRDQDPGLEDYITAINTIAVNRDYAVRPTWESSPVGPHVYSVWTIYNKQTFTLLRLLGLLLLMVVVLVMPLDDGNARLLTPLWQSGRAAWLKS